MSNHVKKRDWRRRGSRHLNVQRFRVARAKTFKSEESAVNWAKKNNVEKYTLHNLRSEESDIKKIRVLVE